MSDPRRQTQPGHRRRPDVIIPIAIGGLLTVSAIAMVSAPARRPVEGDCGLRARLARPRVTVLKSRRLLHLFDNDQLVRTYPIDLGLAPEGPKHRAGDGRTPLGKFRVVTKNARSPYHQFIGIDYPDNAAADWGLASGLISPGEAASIRRALESGDCPDWGTALGGGIGIHGRRMGRDWTGGCIALSDEHMEELFDVLRIGDPIEILP